MNVIQITYPGEVIAAPESNYPIPKKKKKEEAQTPPLPSSSSSSSLPQSSTTAVSSIEKIKSKKGTIKPSTKSKVTKKKKKNKRYVDVNQETKQENTVPNEDSSDNIQVVIVDSNQDLDSNIVIDNPSEDSIHVADEINPLDPVESTGVGVVLDVLDERIDDNDVNEESLDFDEYVRQHAAENEEEDGDNDDDGDDNNGGDDDDAAAQDAAVDSADDNNEMIVKNHDEDDNHDDDGVSMNQAVVDVDEQVLDTDEVEVEKDTIEAAVQLAKTKLSIMELDTISTYCHSGDSLIALCKACLQLDDSVLYTELTNHEHRLFYNSSSTSSSAAALVFDSENGDDKGIHSRTLGKSDHHPLSHPAINVSYNSSINIEQQQQQQQHQQLLVLVGNGIASFLADLLIKPRRAIIKHDLSWLSWTRVIELMCQALKHDFDTLMNWR